MSINEENKTEQQEALNEEKLEQVTGGTIVLVRTEDVRRLERCRHSDSEKQGYRRPDEEERSIRRPPRPFDPRNH